jgi:aspartate racemase
MQNSKSGVIGIVGGVGPFAGLDLNEKIFRITRATKDQDHLNVILMSFSGMIPDRTAFLLSQIKENPAVGAVDVIMKLENAGATVVGIPCNTSHAADIWQEIESKLAENKSKIRLINMIGETAHFIKGRYSSIQKIGLLGTTGTITSDVYGTVLRREGLQVLYPDLSIQEGLVHPAIYDREYGIKSQSKPVSVKAKKHLKTAMKHLIEKKAEAIILGCTEIPLAIKDREYTGIPLIDPTMILARALVLAVAPQKLSPAYHIFQSD